MDADIRSVLGWPDKTPVQSVSGKLIFIGEQKTKQRNDGSGSWTEQFVTIGDLNDRDVTIGCTIVDRDPLVASDKWHEVRVDFGDGKGLKVDHWENGKVNLRLTPSGGLSLGNKIPNTSGGGGVNRQGASSPPPEQQGGGHPRAGIQRSGSTQASPQRSAPTTAQHTERSGGAKGGGVNRGDVAKKLRASTARSVAGYLAAFDGAVFVAREIERRHGVRLHFEQIKEIATSISIDTQKELGMNRPMKYEASDPDVTLASWLGVPDTSARSNVEPNVPAADPGPVNEQQDEADKWEEERSAQATASVVPSDDAEEDDIPF